MNPLNIFFIEDIHNALLAAHEASSSTANVCAIAGGDSLTIEAYLEGYRAALSTVALAFGLSPDRLFQSQKEIPLRKGEFVYLPRGNDPPVGRR